MFWFFHTRKGGFHFIQSSGKRNLCKTFLSHDGKHLLASNEKIWPKGDCNQNLQKKFNSLNLHFFPHKSCDRAVFASRTWCCCKLQILKLAKSYHFFCFLLFLFFFSPPGQIYIWMMPTSPEGNRGARRTNSLGNPRHTSVRDIWESSNGAVPLWVHEMEMQPPRSHKPAAWNSCHACWNCRQTVARSGTRCPASSCPYHRRWMRLWGKQRLKGAAEPPGKSCSMTTLAGEAVLTFGRIERM